MNNHGYYRDDGCESDCATHNEPAYPNGECDCIASLSQRLRKLSAENKGPRDCIDEAADEIEKLNRVLQQKVEENERLNSLFRSAISALARIDVAIGIEDDACNELEITLQVIEDLKADAKRGQNLAVAVMSDNMGRG